MRIRSIKPEFFLHEGLFLLEKETKLPCRLAFIGLWCAADREGRFKWEPRRLGVQIMPYDQHDFSRVLDALTTRGFLVRYASGTCEFGWIPGFTRHQIVNNKEKQSILPPPPDLSQVVEPQPVDACLTRASRVPHASFSGSSGREGKGREGEGNGEVVSRATLDEVKSFCAEKELPASDAEFLFFKWEGNGWTNDGKKIKNWKMTIQAWKAAGYLPSQKKQNENTQRSPQTNHRNDHIAGANDPGRPTALDVLKMRQARHAAGTHDLQGNLLVERPLEKQMDGVRDIASGS